jgi:hypothetical protein
MMGWLGVVARYERSIDAAAQYQDGGVIWNGLYRCRRREAIHYPLRGLMSRQNFCRKNRLNDVGCPAEKLR